MKTTQHGESKKWVCIDFKTFQAHLWNIQSHSLKSVQQNCATAVLEKVTIKRAA